MAVGLIFEHQAQQAVHHARVRIRTAYRHVRHNPDVPVADDLHQLHDRVALRAQRIHAGPIGLGFRRARGANRFRIAMRPQADRLGFAGRLLDLRIGVQFGDIHALLRADHLVLDVRQRGLAHQLLALTLLFDNLDKPLLKTFNQCAQELLGGTSSTTKVTGFDPKTNSVVRGELRIEAHVSANWQIDSSPTNITLDASGTHQELSIFPDILANWLNFLFKERNESNLGISLSRQATLDGFPLQNNIYGFSDGLEVQPMSETLFAYR